MNCTLNNLGFGKTWHRLKTDCYEGTQTRMRDYHMHSYYEMSLILAGKVKVLLPGVADSGEECRLLLLPPETPHYIMQEPGLYKRKNLLFAPDFFEKFMGPATPMQIFSAGGKILKLTAEEADRFLKLIERIEQEPVEYRQQLLLLYFLSLLGELPQTVEKRQILPAYVSDAMAYLSDHYMEKITAVNLALQLHVSRTTLMTGFHRYVGSTMNDYLTQCRLKNAVAMLRGGISEDEAASACGFGDGSNLIRVFRKQLGLTPMQYLGKR